MYLIRNVQTCSTLHTELKFIKSWTFKSPRWQFIMENTELRIYSDTPQIHLNLQVLIFYASPDLYSTLNLRWELSIQTYRRVSSKECIYSMVPLPNWNKSSITQLKITFRLNKVLFLIDVKCDIANKHSKRWYYLDNAQKVISLYLNVLIEYTYAHYGGVVESGII